MNHRLSRDEVVWSFGPDLVPVLEVEPGDVVTFETNDCFTGQIRSEDDLVTEIDLSRINSATGPVAVKGAEPGDSLIAEILDVRPIEWGVATLIPGFGQLIDQVQAPVTRLFEVKDGMIRQNERISFPARPMVGVVGVATDGETLSNGLAGRHGGNLDDHLHGKGARIFFPVRQPGGMFAVGDMHASMGDGEICFTGVEIAGEVDIRFDVLKGKQATWPVTELADCWLPHATADAYDDALKLVSEEAARLLVDEHGFSIEDAFIFLSVACDAGVAQACKPAEGFGTIARFPIPKIEACPQPLPLRRRLQSERGRPDDEPRPRGDDLRRGRIRRDHRREVDGPARARSLRGAAALLAAREVLQRHQPAHPRRAPARTRARRNARTAQLCRVAPARRVRADGEGRLAPADHRRDARVRTLVAALRPRPPLNVVGKSLYSV